MKMAAYTLRAQARDFYGGVETVPLVALSFLSTQNKSLRICFLRRFPVQTPIEVSIAFEFVPTVCI
jgi:hypothetical protein